MTKIAEVAITRKMAHEKAPRKKSSGSNKRKTARKLYMELCEPTERQIENEGFYPFRASYTLGKGERRQIQTFGDPPSWWK